MKIEWLVTNVTAVGSPARAERDFFGTILDFFASSGGYCGRGGTLGSGNPLFSPNNFT